MRNIFVSPKLVDWTRNKTMAVYCIFCPSCLHVISAGLSHIFLQYWAEVKVFSWDALVCHFMNTSDSFYVRPISGTEIKIIWFVESSFAPMQLGWAQTCIVRIRESFEKLTAIIAGCSVCWQNQPSNSSLKCQQRRQSYPRIAEKMSRLIDLCWVFRLFLCFMLHRNELIGRCPYS